MINTSWVEKPEIAVAAFFLGRNLCDLITGLNRVMIILHHVLGMSSILMISTLAPFRDSYLGTHCMYLVYMEMGSLMFNLYVLWPCKFNRNLYFYVMTLSNMAGIIWHWVAGNLGMHRALHDPRIFITVVAGSIITYFRQKEAISICGCPRCLGGNGFIPPGDVITSVNSGESGSLPAKKKKRKVKYAVESIQDIILDAKKSK